MVTVVVGRDERDKDAARYGVVHVGSKGGVVSSGSRMRSGRVVSAEMRLRIVLALGLEEWRKTGPAGSFSFFASLMD
jgi:hypothetical protein